jgi:dTDP-4-amino-4,6-dideoxygalactose transaminase
MAWQNLTPIFTDINASTFNLSVKDITRNISPNTSAIVPVHVFGNPCEVEEIAALAKEKQLKIIYDASHAFGVKYKGQSLLNYGDISTLSFHATKLFHTIEGGAIVTNDAATAVKVRKMINFGFAGAYLHEEQGINAKMNEFEAAMGLCILDEIDNILAQRKTLFSYYQHELTGYVEFQELSKDTLHNNAYAPILFNSESELTQVVEALKKVDVFPRRYFYPSLDTIKYFNSQHTCEISIDISQRILCLPLYVGLKVSEQKVIIDIIKRVL